MGARGKAAATLVATLAFVALLSGDAYANFGPHGSPGSGDTDVCAACHRAHSSYAPLTYTDRRGDQRYGLLISGASSMMEFCLACHGSQTPGASTDVYDGKFDSGPSDSVGGGTAVGANPYQTDSVFDGALNGGAFDPDKATSSHNMALNNQVPMWGSYSNGDSPKTWGLFTCVDCHDPHGSSNYRLLRDQLDGSVVVGGYGKAGSDPWVISNEVGYPQTGFLKGPGGVAQMQGYRPNYTTPHIAANQPEKSLSTWCAGCHTAYAQRDDGSPISVDGQTMYGSYDYKVGATIYEGAGTSAGAIGAQLRHRHPVNVDVAAGPSNGGRLFVDPLYNGALPLEMPELAEADRAAVAQQFNDGQTSGTVVTVGKVGCLTCHFAHGTTVTMKGWASAMLGGGAGGNTLDGNAGATLGSGIAGVVPIQVASQADQTKHTGVQAGVDPGFTSALLRADNRGVCERCHDK